VGPFGLGDGAFDNYMIDLSLVVSPLPLSIKISVGASGNYEDCVVGGECFGLWWGFLDLWWRWVAFGLDLRIGVVGIWYVTCGTVKGYVICGVGEA
jgi:hypothetical protein